MADYMLRRPELIVCGEGVVREKILLYSFDGSEASLVQNGHFSPGSASKRSLVASQDNIVNSATKSSSQTTNSCDSLVEVDGSICDSSDFNFVEPRASPSYLKLSRAVGGYTPYNAYTSLSEHEQLRADNSGSRGKLRPSDKQHRDSEVILQNGEPVVTIRQPRQMPVYGSVEQRSQRILLDRSADVSDGGDFCLPSSSVHDSRSHQIVSPSAAFSSCSDSAVSSAVPSILPPAVLEVSQTNAVALHDGLSNQCEVSSKRSSFHPVCNDLTDPETLQKDGRYFLRLVESAEKRLKSRCERTEVDLKAETSEEAEGRMRAAIGKANLLIQKKFPQFQQLCHANLDQKEDDPFKTTEQDLSGFWDMVLIQVEEVDQQFQAIDWLRKNGWNEPKAPQETHSESLMSSAKPSGTKAKTQKSSSTANVRLPASSSVAAAKAREEARRRLMAAKAAGRQRKASESDKDIEIFVS